MSEILPVVRRTEFWQRMERHLGRVYAYTWSHEQVLAELDGQTVDEALDTGWATKDVWRAVWARLELPPADR